MEISDLSTSELTVHVLKGPRRARLALAVAAACFVAGWWVDWRFLPTGLVPLTVVTAVGWVTAQARPELSKRLRAGGRADVLAFAQTTAEIGTSKDRDAVGPLLAMHQAEHGRPNAEETGHG